MLTIHSDLLVKIVHVTDTSRVSLLSDNTKSVRSATWDPSGKYLVRNGCGNGDAEADSDRLQLVAVESCGYTILLAQHRFY